MTTESQVSHRVLIVDDNLDNVLSSVVLLRQAGHAIHVAYDGPQALEVAELHRPRVILLDIGLPTLNGYEVATRIRREPWGKEMVLLAVTGSSVHNISELCTAAGFDHTFIKPACPIELLQRLSQIPPKSNGPAIAISEVQLDTVAGLGGGTSASPDLPHECQTTQVASSS